MGENGGFKGERNCCSSELLGSTAPKNNNYAFSTKSTDYRNY